MTVPEEWLARGGRTGARIRATDWSSTLGPREAWPASLRTLVSLVVESPVPIALIWGTERVVVSGDAFEAHAPSLARAAGQLWPALVPSLDAVVAGGVMHDVSFPMHGPAREGVSFTCSGVPVRGDDGSISGLLLTLYPHAAESRSGGHAIRDERLAILAAISDASSDAIFAKDRDGRVRFANPATLTLIGKSLDEILGKNDLEILGDNDIARALQDNDRRILERGEPVEVEETVPRLDGTVGVWASRKMPYRDADGRIGGLLGIAREITDRKKAETELVMLAKQGRLALDAAKLGWWHFDPATNAGSYDVRYMEIFGLPDLHWTSERIFPLIHPEDADAVWAAVDAALDPVRSVPYAAEYRIRRPDGAVRFIEAHGQAIFDGDGAGRRAVGLVGTVQDITERKQADEALRQREAELQLTNDELSIARAKLEAIIRTLPTGVCLTDRWGRPVSMNDVALRLHGFSTEAEMLEQLHRDPGQIELRDPDGACIPVDAWPLARFVREDPVTDREIVLCNLRAGTEHVVTISVVPVSDTLGHTLLVVCHMHDITARKRAEDALHLANARLREADQRKNEFLAMLSHELRTPLAPIRIGAHILERTAPDGPEAESARKVIERQTRHLARLVDDLLDVTRISRGKITLQRARIDLVALLRLAAEDHRDVFTRGGIELVVELPEGAIYVEADATRITQVIGNLLGNAAKFASRGGRAVLTVGSASDDEVIVRVTDDGIGMSRATLERIFEPFVQASQSLERSRGGLGLGLALVKGLVELHGGTVAAHSEGEGRGAELTVTLPRTARPRSVRPERRDAWRAPRARRVLVVEDNPDAAESLRVALVLGRHEVTVVHSGPEGVRAAKHHRPDVVLCDIGLPELDGYGVARALRADPDPAVRGAFLVALTGYARPEDVERARDAGFDRHLPKAPDMATLEKIFADAGGG